jgi:hypothetical protein
VEVLRPARVRAVYRSVVVNNELVLLDQVLKQRQDERSTPIKDDDAFELFACEQALGERDLSMEEVADGVVGGGNDGGLDGVYVFRPFSYAVFCRSSRRV